MEMVTSSDPVMRLGTRNDEGFEVEIVEHAIGDYDETWLLGGMRVATGAMSFLVELSGRVTGSRSERVAFGFLNEGAVGA